MPRGRFLFGSRQDPFYDLRDRKRPFKKIIFPLEIAGVVVLAFLLVFFFGIQVRISDASMGDTLQAGQRVLLNRFTYHISEPKADDIVLYKTEGSGWEHNTVKRVVAVPGDYVQIIDGYLYVNEERYESYAKTRIDMPGIAKDGILLADQEYFLMGDDPSTSEDSRYESVGTISESAIAGKIWLRISPFDEFGRIE